MRTSVLTRRALGRLGAVLVLTVALALSVLAPASAASPKRGQARIYIAAFLGNPRTGVPYSSPAKLTIFGGVRYVDHGTWQPRRGALIHIQKRVSSGAWVTIGVTRTSWSSRDTLDNDSQAFLDVNTYAILTSPYQRWLRVYVPGNAGYKPVVSEPVRATSVNPQAARATSVAAGVAALAG